MRTTLEIPEGTFRRVKAAAEGLGIPAGEYVVRAVEEKLARASGGPGRPWLACAGELAHLHEETVRIQRLVDEEFGFGTD